MANFTPILRLEISPLLTPEAKANLLKIDALGRGVTTDALGNTLIRSEENISLLPQDASVGGTGIGGAINLGSPSQILDTVTSYAAETRIQGSLDLADQAPLGAFYLRMQYLSTAVGPVETADRILTWDIGSGNRAIVLGTDLTIGPSILGIGPLSFVLPTSNDSLVGAVETVTLTNKTIDANLNTISNITAANISPSAAIPYSKLDLANSIQFSDLSPGFLLPYSRLTLTNSITNADVAAAAGIVYSKLLLTGSIVTADISAGFLLPYSKLVLANSIVDADISSGAAIQGSKVVPHFGAQFISTSAGIDLINGSFKTHLQSSISQTGNVSLVLPPTIPTTNQVLSATAIPGELAWVSAGTGSVTSVALAVDAEGDAIFDVSGSPITTAGTLQLSLATQVAATVLAGPISGPSTKPAFRVLATTDLPNLDETIQDSIGGILTNSPTVSLTYDDATPSIIAALLNTAVTPGSYGSATQVGTFTVDAQGRLTSASNVAIAIPASSITGFDEAAQDAVGAMTTNSSNVTLTYVDATPSLTADLTNTAVTPGSYGTASSVSTVVVDAKGRLTSSSNTPIVIASSAVTGFDESAQDAIGAMLINSSNITLTYVDATPSLAADLTNTAVTPGTYGTASSVSTITVDAKGRVTAAANTPIVIASGSVTGFDEAAQDAVGAIVTNSSDITLTYVDATPSLTAALINTAVTPGTYGTATAVGTFTVDAKGRLTAASATPIAIPSSQITDKGNAGGVASLDGAGKVPIAQLPNSIMQYVGVWNASTNSPTLANGAGNPDVDIGDVYRVGTAGTTDFGAGPIAFSVGDYAILNDSKIWEKADTTDAVASVDGLIGIVVLNASSTWTSGTTFAYTHNLGSSDVSVTIRDLADNQVIWVDSIIVTSSNRVDLTSSVVPSGSGWRVTVQR